MNAPRLDSEDSEEALMKTLLCVLALLALGTMAATAQQPAARSFEGMWSDPPATITGDFCASWCTDAGINQLNAFLDDPKNDARPLAQLRTEASNYSLEKYIRPRLN